MQRARVLVLLGALSLAACNGAEVRERQAPDQGLKLDLVSARTPLTPQDDYWTESLGHFLSPEELYRYWLTSQEQRFASYGDRWLEFCLREDLLREHVSRLSPEQLDDYCSQPDYEAGRARLAEMLKAEHD